MKRGPEEAVAITGIGSLTALGDMRAAWDAIVRGRSAVTLHRLDDCDNFPPLPAAPVTDNPVREYLVDRKLQKYMSPSSAMAVTAAGRALEDASLIAEGGRCLDAGMGLFVVTGLTGFDLSTVAPAIEACIDENGVLDLQGMGGEGMRRCHPLMPFKSLSNMPLGLVSIAFGIEGENFVLYPDGAQAGTCLEAALRGIVARRFTRALVGGTNHGVSLLPVGTLSRDGRLASDPGRAVPFQRNHQGYAPADGACFAVLENASAARSRGAQIYGRLSSATVHHSIESTHSRPYPVAFNCGSGGEQRPDIVVSVENLCLADDQAELAALEWAWPGSLPGLTSFDGNSGYLGAASFFFALGCVAMALSTGFVPPTYGADPQLGERLLTGESTGDAFRSIAVSSTHTRGLRAVANVVREELAP